MKILTPFFLTVIISINVSTGQSFESLYTKLSRFNSSKQYNSINKEILNAINFILTQPFPDRRDPSTQIYFAIKSMTKWMNNIDSYQIIIGGKVIESCKGDVLMQNIYMAAMGKFLLKERYENNRHIYPIKQPDVKYMELPEVKETLLEGAKIFFDYLKNTSGIKPNRELRKGIKAWKKGNLEEYMFE